MNKRENQTRIFSAFSRTDLSTHIFRNSTNGLQFAVAGLIMHNELV